MKTKPIKIAFLSVIAVLMIATILSYSVLQHTFYMGRTQYLTGTNPGIVSIDPNGQPWVVQNINEGGQLESLQGERWVPQPYMGWASSMVFDRDGTLWIASDQGGLYRIDGKNRTALNSSNSGLASSRVEHITFDKLGRMWIDYSLAYAGVSAPEPAFGVTVFDGTSWRTFTTQNSELISNEVAAIAFDKENRAWFGTPDGISIFDGKKWMSYSPGNSGLVVDVISAIAFDGQGSAWIGTARGINIFDGKQWVYHTLEQIGFRGPRSDFGAQIVIDRPGRIWVEQNGEVRIFDGHSWIGLAEEDGYNNNTGAITTDGRGNIWYANGNMRGLVKLDADYSLAAAWKTQPLRIFLSSGGLWYVAFVLACLFLAILLDAAATVALGLLAGISVFIGFAALLHDWHTFYVALFGNPGIYATVGTMIGAFVGIRLATRSGKSTRTRFAVIGLVLGLGIGICQIAPFFLMQ